MHTVAACADLSRLEVTSRSSWLLSCGREAEEAAVSVGYVASRLMAAHRTHVLTHTLTAPWQITVEVGVDVR